MPTRFVASSVNIVANVYGGNRINTQNARIHFDTVDTSGWTTNTTRGSELYGTFNGGSELRRSVLDGDLKTSSVNSLNVDNGITYEYVSAQKRTVKVANGTQSTSRVVFVPSRL